MGVTITETGYQMMLLVQQRLYEGLEPDTDGYYIIKRKEFIDRLGLPSSTVSSRIGDLVKCYMQQWNLGIIFGLKGLEKENLYTEVYYSNGQLRFKRNPYTMIPELQYVWDRKPVDWEHRRFRYEQISVPESVKLPINKESLQESSIVNTNQNISISSRNSIVNTSEEEKNCFD